MYNSPVVISIFDTVYSMKEYLNAYLRFTILNRRPSNIAFADYCTTPFLIELLKEMFDGSISLATSANELRSVKLLVHDGLPLQNALELRKMVSDSLMMIVTGCFPDESLDVMQRTLFDIANEFDLVVSLYTVN